MHMRVDYNPYEGREVTGAARRRAVARARRDRERHVRRTRRRGQLHQAKQQILAARGRRLERTMSSKLSVEFTGLQFRQPVPALVRASDRVGVEHHARVRGGLGRRGHQDHRPPPGRQRQGTEDQVPPRDARPAAPLDAEAARHGAALVVELGAHLGQAARLVGAADRRASRRRFPTRSSSRRSWPARAPTRSCRTGRRWQSACQDRAPTRSSSTCPVRTWTAPDMGSNIGKDERAHLGRDAGREGGRAHSGVGQAHAVDDRHRRRGARRISRRRRRDRRRRTRSRRCRSSTRRRSTSR